FIHQLKGAVLNTGNHHHQNNRHYKHQRDARFIAQQYFNVFFYGDQQLIHQSLKSLPVKLKNNSSRLFFLYFLFSSSSVPSATIFPLSISAILRHNVSASLNWCEV